MARHNCSGNGTCVAYSRLVHLLAEVPLGKALDRMGFLTPLPGGLVYSGVHEPPRRAPWMLRRKDTYLEEGCVGRCLVVLEELSVSTLHEWRRPMSFEGADPSLPPLVGGQIIRAVLSGCLASGSRVAAIARQNRGEADPLWVHEPHTGGPATPR